MADKLIRLGKVSSIDYGNGMIAVTYPDMDDATTVTFPVFAFTGEYKMPAVGEDVLVLHLSNGTSAGIVMGRYWNKNNTPAVSGADVFRKELGSTPGEAYIQYSGGNITFHDQSGSVTLSQIIRLLNS